MKTPVVVSSLMAGISLIINLTGAIAPAHADQPPPTIRSVEEVPAPPSSTGTVEDLGQLNPNTQNWRWGNTPASRGNQQSGSYQINGNTAPNTADPNQELQDWNNSNRGDSFNRSPGIPLTEF